MADRSAARRQQQDPARRPAARQPGDHAPQAGDTGAQGTRAPRAATDAGLTGDKVGAEDPAAAPLETDAETSGTPTDPAMAMSQTRDQQRIAAEHAAGVTTAARNPQPERSGGPAASKHSVKGALWAAIGGAVVAGLALVAILAMI